MNRMNTIGLTLFLGTAVAVVVHQGPFSMAAGALCIGWIAGRLSTYVTIRTWTSTELP